MSKSTARLTAENSALVVIDIQDRLLAKIPTQESLLRNVGFLLDCAALLDVPVRGTEQYPKGLGPSHQEIRRRLSQAPAEKTAFSCCGAGIFLEELEMLARPNVVLVGMETHVCVQQTALDMIAAGLHVYLPVDSLAARTTLDHDVAIRRLERAGSISTTCESIAFEWLRDSSHPQFKAVSKLVIARSQ